MKNGILLVGCFALAALSPWGEAPAQDAQPPVRFFSGIVDEDAPQPAAPVFEAPPAPPDPFGAPIARPVVPAFAPAAPRAVGHGGALTPADGEAAAVDAFRVQLTDSSQIVGQLLLDAPLVVKTKYGEMKLAVEDIARIDGAVDEGHWRFTLTGGDRVTGSVKLTGLVLKTSWGEVKLDEKKIAALESGKLQTQQVPVARTSPDGRTRSTAYRTRQIFMPVTEIHADSPHGYPSASPSYYAPTTTYPMPVFSAPAVAPSGTLVPRPR